MNWYTLFRQHILDRGIEYYEDGNVVDFQCTEDSISAHVDGTDIYDVEIKIEGEEVIDIIVPARMPGEERIVSIWQLHYFDLRRCLQITMRRGFLSN